MINFPLATTTWDKAEIEAIQKVVDSGHFTMGAKVKEYEVRFAEKFSSKYCVMVNSGSSANLLMIAALMFSSNKKIKLYKGDEILVPAVSWATTYYPLAQYGLKIKFVDIDRSTLNFDLNSLRGAINSKTKAIFCVNLLGNPNDFTEVLEVAHKNDLSIIEDNCESMGATFKGKQCGGFGLMGSFSSYFSHHISTMEGGCIITDDEELYHILLSLRSHGWTRNLPLENKVTGKKSNNEFYESFNFVLPGYNVRPLEMSAAIGLAQLEKLDKIVSGRRANAYFFKTLFEGHPRIEIQSEIGMSSWFGFSLLFNENSPISRNQAVKLLKEEGIECRPIVSGNFTRNPVIELLETTPIDQNKLKNANFIHESGLFVGNHHYDLKNEITALFNILSQ